MDYSPNNTSNGTREKEMVNRLLWVTKYTFSTTIPLYAFARLSFVSITF
jgi:hypothetical protein